MVLVAPSLGTELYDHREHLREHDSVRREREICPDVNLWSAHMPIGVSLHSNTNLHTHTLKRFKKYMSAVIYANPRKPQR